MHRPEQKRAHSLLLTRNARNQSREGDVSLLCVHFIDPTWVFLIFSYYDRGLATVVWSLSVITEKERQSPNEGSLFVSFSASVYLEILGMLLAPCKLQHRRESLI